MALERHRLLKRSLHDLTSVRADDLRGIPKDVHLDRAPTAVSLLEPAHSQVICIASGKGGTGKTVVATNLAVLLAKEGKKVLLFDADLGLANAHLLMGVAPVYDVSEVLSGEKKMKDIMVECPDGVQLIPGGSGFSELAELKDWRFRYLARRLKEMEKDIDLIFVDMSAGISPQVMRFLSAAHEIILVTNPDITALIDAYATIKSLVVNVRQNVRVKLIINRVRNNDELVAAFKKLRRVVDKHLTRCHCERSEAIQCKQFNSSPLGERDGACPEQSRRVRGIKVDISLLGWLPQNWYIQNSVFKRKPVVLLHPRSFVTKCLYRMARQVKNQHLRWRCKQEKMELRDTSFFAKLEQMVFE